DVELRDPNLPLANVQVQSANGNIVVALPGGSNFALEARTTRGKVENEYGDIIQIEDIGRSARRRGATASRSGSGAQIRLSTERGDITLKKASHLQSL